VSVLPLHHRRSHEPSRGRSANGYVVLAVFSVSLLGACTDVGTPLSPDHSGANSAAAHRSMDRSLAGDADDVIDALDRISPAFGETPAANQVRGALKQLAQDALQNDAAAIRRSAGLLGEALDRLESLGDPSLGAEIDAVRLVADARK